MKRERLVLIPPHVSPSALRGATSGLASGVLEGESMGTSWKLGYQRPRSIPDGKIRAAVEETFSLVIAQMSHWDQESELCTFTRAPAGTWQRLSPEFFGVLERSLAIAEAAGGHCDPTLGGLVDLYGFGPVAPSETFPDKENLEKAKSRSGWPRLRLREETREAFQPGGCQLDLSATAKGYAVDLATHSLINLGLLDFVLELGGEVRGHGCKHGGQPWWVSIDMPPDLPPVVVALCDLSMATSGCTFRQRTVEGRQISHLIQPSTGMPAENTLLSVSVFSKSCLDADSWATALYVAGAEEGITLAEDHKLAALFVNKVAEGHEIMLSSDALPMSH